VCADQHGEFDDAPRVDKVVEGPGGGVGTDQHGEFDDGVAGPGGGVSTDQHGQFDDGANEDAKAADDSFVAEGEPKRPQE
jgi:hypothetical protein